MKSLTKAEEQIMQSLWQIKQGFASEIMEALPEPKPAYNTALTVVRILEKKGFIGYNVFGKTHRYHPLVSKENYSEMLLQDMARNYFDNSFKNIVSFFANNRNITLKDLDEIREIIKKNQENH
ncbi:MAG: BlaI/MecI/CopY family transcriptional regulator [Tannerella sp.]|jgi:predicted transcriptional regulator|nr:BlaI/MecI/CopY family transcriptional regulator [Tannerella sp.]